MLARNPETDCGTRIGQDNACGPAHAGTLKRSSSLATAFARPGLPLSAWTATALVGGIALGSVVPPAPLYFLAAAPICLGAANLLRRRRLRWGCVFCVLAAIVVLGATRWQLYQTPSARTSLKNICGDGPAILTLTGHIASVPCLHVRPSSKIAPRLFGSAEQSRFLVSALSVMSPVGQRHAEGSYQVYVDGDATGTLHIGDKVTLTGRWDWPDTPGNPGEFNFEQFLNRRRGSGLLFVNHPAAIRVVESCSQWSPGYWVSELRRETRSVLVTSLPEHVPTGTRPGNGDRPVTG
ncbi:MAG: ComEC/Rec2 family competence protein [Fuerstiella sp.]|nr:ComEC/Rec2 family competence protein [Fuerstiella sp.]